jgi:ParB-like nuclease domain
VPPRFTPKTSRQSSSKLFRTFSYVNAGVVDENVAATEIGSRSMASVFPLRLGPLRPAPFLEWIAVERLVVDTEYQRESGRRGATNVIQIAEHFDRSKFAPVIVAPVEGGRFAIVDGQHRTTAATLRVCPDTLGRITKFSKHEPN